VPRKTRDPASIVRRYDKLDDMELVEAVCERFCEGKSASAIREELRKPPLRRTLSREQPYQILAYAGIKGWLKFNPPLEYSLARRLTDEHGWLHGVEVVRTQSLEYVAMRAAAVLLRLVRQIRYEKSEVHIGLAGGWTVLQVVKHFADLLNQPPDDLPDKLCFHAMVTGLQLHHPETDPNTFYNYIWPLSLQTDFLALYGPVLPDRRMIEWLRNEHGPTQRAFQAGEDIDIIVTSGSSWRDEHSQLKNLIQREYADEVEKLERQGCVGDVLWQPISEEGPIGDENDDGENDDGENDDGENGEDESGVRAMTLMRLEDLPGAIERGTRVLLVLGPCGRCATPRGDLLQTLLDFEDRYFTHLVTDHRTATFSSETGATDE